MKTCVIMQPTYLPWAGYFNLIHQADAFVFLDDVQFEKQSWQNRNRVILDGQPHWLTVSVNRESLQQKIFEITLDEKANWREKHVRLIEQVYSKKPFKSDLSEILELIIDKNTKLLNELNTKIIQKCCEKMG